MTFGPISILPEYKRKGYGRKYWFYGKSGFVVASTKGIHYYAEPRENEVPYFLVKELEEGFLDGMEGIYHTPEGYFVDEKEAEIFDQKFPKKEKLKLSGQLG